ncbi:MAG: SNF2 helicase-associated domain-containing protein, partial [Acidimicrobiales bacterium]
MHADTETLESAIWAAAEDAATADQLALLVADPEATARHLERLLDDTEVRLEVVLTLTGPERDQVVADFEDELGGLQAIYDRLVGDEPAALSAEPQKVRLQASWSDGEVVVWAGAPGMAPAGNDQVADLLEALEGPALGWTLHAGVRLPSGTRAEAVAIPVAEALGWLVAIGGGLGGDDVAPSARWLGRLAALAVGLVSQGAVVPTLQTTRRPASKGVDAGVRWRPALLGDDLLTELANTMPGPAAVLTPALTPRALATEVLGAVVHAIVVEAASRLELPAPPPNPRTTADVAEAAITRLDGSAFAAPPSSVTEVARRLERWAKPVTTAARPHLVVLLDAPDKSDAWFLSVLGPGPGGTLLPVEQALAATKSTQPVATELARLERALPLLQRAGALRRGQVYVSTAEAWDLMTMVGPALQSAGFEVRAPALSRRTPKPGLRLFVEPSGDTVVGAHQLSQVRWSAVFDDVELTAADVTRLAADARPLVRSRGRWVELDRVDLKEAAAALAERSGTTQLTGAEILRHAVGLESSGLSERLSVTGSGWASDLLGKAATATTAPITKPEGFVGELRSYQAEALGWLGFLDTVELGGCLALDMGLGKTPTMLAHLARTA